MQRWLITEEGIKRLLEKPEELDEDSKIILRYLYSSNTTIREACKRDKRLKELLEK